MVGNRQKSLMCLKMYGDSVTTSADYGCCDCSSCGLFDIIHEISLFTKTHTRNWKLHYNGFIHISVCLFLFANFSFDLNIKDVQILSVCSLLNQFV